VPRRGGDVGTGRGGRLAAVGGGREPPPKGKKSSKLQVRVCGGKYPQTKEI